RRDLVLYLRGGDPRAVGRGGAVHLGDQGHVRADLRPEGERRCRRHRRAQPCHGDTDGGGDRDCQSSDRRPCRSPGIGAVAWDDPAIAGALAVAWDYMRLVHEARPADAILTLGSFDPKAAVHAASLWRARPAPVAIISGGPAPPG